jgi:hypothetical protein
METDEFSRAVDDRSSQRERQSYRKRLRGEASSSRYSAAAEDQEELEVMKIDSSRLGKIVFGDESTADILLTFTCPTRTEDGRLDLLKEETVGTVHLHSRVLGKSRYFKTLLSERWQDSKRKVAVEESNKNPAQEQLLQMHLSIPTRDLLPVYEKTLSLLYTGDFSGVRLSVVFVVPILAAATVLLFDDLITSCISYLEAVPWNKEEERMIVRYLDHYQLKQSNLLARLSPVEDNAVEEMLNNLIHAATHSPRNILIPVKTFVARMLSDHGSRDTIRVVLERAFASTLKTVQDSVEEYSNPNVRGRYDEIEALQRQNLHTAVGHARSLLWVVERMIELRVAKTAVIEWSEQGKFTANLKRAFSDDTWRNIAPGLPSQILRCTCRLASGVASGSITASTQVNSLKLGSIFVFICRLGSW